ncbi:hypothetical protein ACOSQ3_003065 [Xanthoceras sorbifolium]
MNVHFSDTKSIYNMQQNLGYLCFNHVYTSLFSESWMRPFEYKNIVGGRNQVAPVARQELQPFQEIRNYVLFDMVFLALLFLSCFLCFMPKLFMLLCFAFSDDNTTKILTSTINSFIHQLQAFTGISLILIFLLLFSFLTHLITEIIFLF